MLQASGAITSLNLNSFEPWLLAVIVMVSGDVSCKRREKILKIDAVVAGSLSGEIMNKDLVIVFSG